jgi:hypothetical protein
MRIRIVQNHKQHKEGDIVDVSPNEAFGLIDSGIAIVSKDIVSVDTKKGGIDGRSTKLRTNHRI